MTGVAQLDDLLSLVRTRGGTADEVPSGFAVDFNNVYLGGPYIEGTGYFPDRATAEAFASVILPILTAIADEALRDNPQIGDVWTHPEAEIASWCYIISAQRKGFEGNPTEGDPVVEEMFEGDAWFLAGVALGEPFITADERVTLDKLRAVLAGTP